MPDTQAYPDFEVAIIGAGPGGIAAAVKVAAAGIDDFVIIERADDIGGSWHENHYPGLSVDIPAIAYQYSFARNPNCSRVFPRGAEPLTKTSPPLRRCSPVASSPTTSSSPAKLSARLRSSSGLSRRQALSVPASNH